MKFSLFLILLLTNAVWAQLSPLPSQVFSISGESIRTKYGTKSVIFKGEGDVLKIQEMNLLRIRGHKKINCLVPADREHFYILKKGALRIKMAGKEWDLSVGSMLTILPSEPIQFTNTSQEEVEIYMMTYLSKAPMNKERGTSAGGSFLVPWESAVFKATAKGGGRQFFDRPTAMLNRFDIHVTTLNVGQQSHDPHTHVNEEIILMIEGHAEERIGDARERAKAGDVIRLGSKVLHNITNVGDTPCTYYAIQWN
jgi:(S)-ureidoglycine aminohydrolase